MEAFAEAYWLVLSFDVIIVMIVGVAAGVVIGALPGLGPTLGVTLALPFTFAMEPTAAIALMLAIYCASTFGGAISAILINTPGTAASAATAYDGFPMVKKGQADVALGWTTLASVTGGLLSVVILMIAAPQLAALSLRFGPAQTAALILMALSCIATVSPESTTKGLICGIAGMVTAMIGTDPISGSTRFTFDSFQLTAGFNLIAVIVGMFALSEVLVRATEKAVAVDSASIAAGFRFPSLTEFGQRTGNLLRSSVVGTFMGSLPGSGSAIASFMAYGWAARSSRHKENFGKGEPDGLIASESANNAVTGGALIPTLALGIPGDSVTAVMMSSFLIHGVQTGTRLFSESQVALYAMYESLIIINLLLLVGGFLGAHLFSRMLRIPEPLLMGAVLVLSIVGAYSARSNMFDVWVMIGFGVLGLLMRLYRYPIAPFIIGFVLGLPFEENLRTALILTNYNIPRLFSGSITQIILVLTLGFLLLPLLSRMLSRQQKQEQT